MDTLNPEYLFRQTAAQVRPSSVRAAVAPPLATAGSGPLWFRLFRDSIWFVSPAAFSGLDFLQ